MWPWDGKNSHRFTPLSQPLPLHCSCRRQFTGQRQKKGTAGSCIDLKVKQGGSVAIKGLKAMERKATDAFSAHCMTAVQPFLSYTPAVRCPPMSSKHWT